MSATEKAALAAASGGAAAGSSGKERCCGCIPWPRIEDTDQQQTQKHIATARDGKAQQPGVAAVHVTDGDLQQQKQQQPPQQQQPQPQPQPL